MKKLIILLVLVFSGTIANAQINVGLSAGLPSGDFSDAYSLSVHLDASYVTEISDDFLLGGTTGLLYTLGDTVGNIEFDDLGYVPVAAAARYVISEKITTGVDVGYAIGVAPSGVGSGFYYAAKGQYSFSENLSGVLGFRSLSDNGATLSFLTVGVELKL
jgi:hypothetical protein